jgi:acetyl-CoA carboxylase biotin carboxyl carrier protein
MSDFDIDGDLVRRLAALLEETGLTEIEYCAGEQRVRVSRAATGVLSAAAPAGAVSTPVAESDTAATSHPGAVTAPMVGTVYLAPEPGADPFVRVGDQVTEGQTLVLIEAMKTYNPVRAPRGGKVTQIMVADSAPVEYGQDLIIVE